MDLEIARECVAVNLCGDVRESVKILWTRFKINEIKV